MISPENESSRRLCAILFADIQGYTSMMQKDEANALTILQRYQNVLDNEVNRYGGEVIKNYGDGSICIFSTTVNAVRSAKVIQELLREEPVVPLRVGLHVGDVILKKGDIYGDSVNIASRIESMGVAGNILLSQSFYRKVKNQSEFDFKSIGSFHFKNVEEKIEVYAVTNEGFPIPDKKLLIGKFQQESGKKKLTGWLLSAIIFIMIGMVYWQYHPRDTEEIDPFSFTNSLLILPIKDNSTNQDHEYLVDGITTEIINLLSRVPHLKVLGRHTSFSYEGKDIDITTIADTMGVNYVLEGTAIVDDNLIKIDLQLLNGKTGETIWPYQIIESIENIFQLQKDISIKVCNELEMSIIENTLDPIETEDVKAYLLYLKGFYLQTKSFDQELNSYETLYEESYQLDSNFLPNMWALQTTKDLKRQSGFLSHEEVMEYKEYMIDRMISIDSTSSWTLLCRATYHSQYDFDFEKGYIYLNKTLSSHPLPLELLAASALNMRHFDVERAIYIGNKSLELDPAYPWNYHNLAWIYFNAQEYDKCIEMFDKFESLTLNSSEVADWFKNFIDIIAGNFEEIPALWGSSPQIDLLKDIMICSRDGMDEMFESKVTEYKSSYPSDYLGIAQIYAYRKETELALDWLEKGLLADDPAITENINLKYFEPWLFNLYNNPRWLNLLERIGFLSDLKN